MQSKLRDHSILTSNITILQEVNPHTKQPFKSSFQCFSIHVIIDLRKVSSLEGKCLAATMHRISTKLMRGTAAGETGYIRNCKTYDTYSDVMLVCDLSCD